MGKFLLLNKPTGISSFKFIYPLKRVYKKVGHSGTLDPGAEGLLVVAVGRATKFIRFLPGEKGYEFTIRFGFRTDSDDLDGVVVESNDLKPSLEQVRAVLSSFVGEISQTPSAFSAVKVNGKRAYELARKGCFVKLSSRTVFIYDLQLRGFDEDSASFFVRCSKGTYVRSLSSDICAALGVLGCVVKLRRVLSNGFSLEDGESEVGLDCVRSFYPVLSLDEGQIMILKNGGSVALCFKEDGVHSLVDKNKLFVGLVEIAKSQVFKLCFI